MIIQSRPKIILALAGSLALAGCVELAEAIEDQVAAPAPAGTASAPARSSNTAATRSEVVPLHQRASQNTFHENDSPSDDDGSDTDGSDTGGGFDGGGFDEPEPETAPPGGWTG